MAHADQAEFFSMMKSHYSEYFTKSKVLEVGALDINGSVRPFFQDCEYVGVDLEMGPGVDLACQGQLLEFPTGYFDTTVSAECLEHNPYWRETLANMFRMTKPGGLVMISCASTGRREHGTSRTNSFASPFTTAANWDYYQNLSCKQIESALNLDGWLSDWSSWVNFVARDLYFVGLRNGTNANLSSAMKQQFSARYALTYSIQSLKSGVKTKVLGELLTRG